MLNYTDLSKESRVGELSFKKIEFRCEKCNKILSEDSFHLSVFLYGVFHLYKRNTSYVGITCPSCLETIVIKEKKSPSSLFKKLSSLVTFGNFEFIPKLIYFSSVYNYNYFNNNFLSFKEFNLYYYQIPVGFEGHHYINETLENYVAENELENHLCSFNESEFTLLPNELFVLYIDEIYLEKIVKFEINNNIRIIPRYMYNNPVFNQIDLFCFKNDYQSRLSSMETAFNENIKILNQSFEMNNVSFDELVAKDPSIIRPNLIEFLQHNYQKREDVKVNTSSDFLSILISDKYPHVFMFDECDVFGSQLKIKHPFKDKEIPLSLKDISKKNFDEESLNKHQKMLNEIKPVYSKSYIQKYLCDQHNNFIKEYSQIVMNYAFSYADIWELKEHYLEKIYNIVRKKKATRPSFNHREACRRVAKDLWTKQPDVTIADMCLCDAIATACEGTVYPEATLRKWIKDLCPNRKPGRRPKKTKK